MKKIIPLLFLIFLVSITSTIALTVTDTTNVSCTGKLTYSDKILTNTGVDDDGNHAVIVQATAGFPEDNIIVIDDGCNIVRSNTWSHGTISASSWGTYFNNEYFFGFDVGGTDTVYVFDDTTLTLTDSWTTPFSYTNWDLTTDNNYFYIVSENNYVDRYSTNGVWLDRINITTDITSTQAKGIIYNFDKNTFLISYTDGNFYETSPDFQTKLSETTSTKTNGRISDWGSLSITNGLQVVMKTDSDQIDVINITDTSTLNYFLINGTNYSTNLCIDSETYCENTNYITNVLGEIVFYCEDSNVTYCSSGCTNTETGGVVTGVCEQLGCTNDCNILGGTYCSSGTTYSTCGQFDSDACLELGEPLFCPANQYCSDTNVGSQCSTVTEGTEYNQDYLVVSVELSNLSGILKDEGEDSVPESFLNSLSETLTIANPLISLLSTVTTYIVDSFSKDEITETFTATVFEQGTSISSDFLGVSCDYQQTHFLMDNLEHNDLVGYGWTGDGTINNSAVHEYVNTTTQLNKTIESHNNNIVDTIIELSDTGTYNIKIYSGTTTQLDYEIVHNKTSFNTYMIEKENGKTIFNSTSTSDDLQQIFLSTSFINDVNTANVEVSLIRDVLGVDINENYYSLPLSINSGNLEKIVYEANGNNLIIYQVIGYYVNDYPVYDENSETSKLFGCVQSTAECYHIRVYGNEQGMSTYHFYEDVQVCVNSLDGLVNLDVPSLEDERTDIEKVLGKNWNDNQKLLFAGFILLLVFGLFSALSYVEKDGTFALVGTIISGILMFYFILVGFIPTWLIILFAIIGSAIGGWAIKSMIFGKGQ